MKIFTKSQESLMVGSSKNVKIVVYEKVNNSSTSSIFIRWHHLRS